MEGLNHKHEDHKPHSIGADLTTTASSSNSRSKGAKGSSIHDTELNRALNQAAEPSLKLNDEHNHEKPANAGNFSFHAPLSSVADVKGLSNNNIKGEFSLSENLGNRGDFLDPGAGKNTVIGSGDDDVIMGTGGGFNTITTGNGKDTVVLGAETTNRIFDFNPAEDRFLLAKNLKPNDIIIAQGKNQGKGGIDQPLDSVSNTLIIDKSTEHILASMTFVKSADVSDRHFAKLEDKALKSLDFIKFNTKEGNGQITGTREHDKLIGGGGDDFLYLGDDGFSFGTAKGTGPGEFPFPNTSAGTTELNLNLKSGVLTIDGSYKDFEGLPLFSDGVQDVAPDAFIPNGADAKGLIDNFLKVPQDSEGNPLSGFHLHFSRENFADATVERYLTVNRKDDRSGTVSAQFELNSEEQAALLARNIYANLHSTKHPVGENRVELSTINFA
ncbi:MAG TPA: CHRD domain-containing protein [Trichocoleus sp.]|jgi:hypothetical protein